MYDIENLDLDDIEKELCEREFYFFFTKAWKVIEPDTKLIDNWHIKYICDLLQKETERIINGKQKSKDIIITIPPRTLKSTIVSVILNAWAWSVAPYLKFITASYSGDLATELSIKTRRLLDSDWFQKNWGNKVKFSPDQNVKSKYENTANGLRKAVGVGGSITGSGADFIVIDDPINPLDALSEAKRNECINWFKNTIYTRLNDQKIGIRIIISQRLHENDLVGWIEQNQKEKWEIIKMPVSDEFEIKPKELKKWYKDGLFFPKRFSKEEIKEFKNVMGSYFFAGQMGQSPAPAGGGIFKRDWFKFYNINDKPKFLRLIWSWDTAGKEKEQNDFSVGLLFGVSQDGYYLLDMVRDKMKYPDLKRAILKCFAQYPHSSFLIEDKTSGQSIIQDLRASTRIPIKDIMPIKDKVSRAYVASPVVEAGKVHLPESSYIITDFLHEITMFPNAEHDDIVDAFTQFINYVSSSKSAKELLNKFKGDNTLKSKNII